MPPSIAPFFATHRIPNIHLIFHQLSAVDISPFLCHLSAPLEVVNDIGAGRHTYRIKITSSANDLQRVLQLRYLAGYNNAISQLREVCTPRTTKLRSAIHILAPLLRACPPTVWTSVQVLEIDVRKLGGLPLEAFLPRSDSISNGWPALRSVHIVADTSSPAFPAAQLLELVQSLQLSQSSTAALVLVDVRLESEEGMDTLRSLFKTVEVRGDPLSVAE